MLTIRLLIVITWGIMIGVAFAVLTSLRDYTIGVRSFLILFPIQAYIIIKLKNEQEMIWNLLYCSKRFRVLYV